jgi:hypothetical protein
MPGTRPGMTSRDTRGRERSRPFSSLRANRSNPLLWTHGLLRRFAPRNDGCRWLLPATQLPALLFTRRHRPRRRTIQYAVASRFDRRRQRLLDARLRGHDGGSAIPSSSFRGAPSASPESITTIVSMDSGPAPSGASTMCNCTSGNDGGESLPTVSRPALSHLAPLAGRGRIASQMRSG